MENSVIHLHGNIQIVMCVDLRKHQVIDIKLRMQLIIPLSTITTIIMCQEIRTMNRVFLYTARRMVKKLKDSTVQLILTVITFLNKLNKLHPTFITAQTCCNNTLPMRISQYAAHEPVNSASLELQQDLGVAVQMRPQSNFLVMDTAS